MQKTRKEVAASIKCKVQNGKICYAIIVLVQSGPHASLKVILVNNKFIIL